MAVVLVDDPLRDGESEAGACAFPRLVRAVEAFENVRKFALFDAASRILDLQVGEIFFVQAVGEEDFFACGRVSGRR